MTKYIALLRGINISGKNKILMTELKKEFENLDFANVVTYINSGNVIFDANETNEISLAEKISSMIKKKFGYDVPTYIITPEKLEDILEQAPSWWGTEDKEIYDKLICIIPPTTYDEVHAEVGDPRYEMEWISNYKDAIFWSFITKYHAKANWMKTASSSINDKVTIRTAGTMRKVLELSRKSNKILIN